MRKVVSRVLSRLLDLVVRLVLWNSSGVRYIILVRRRIFVFYALRFVRHFSSSCYRQYALIFIAVGLEQDFYSLIEIHLRKLIPRVIRI